MGTEIAKLMRMSVLFKPTVGVISAKFERRVFFLEYIRFHCSIHVWIHSK